MTPPAVKRRSVLAKLKDVSLDKGAHSTFESGHCVMEATAYIAGQPHSAAPPCVSPVITAFMISWNDALPDNATRDRLLKPLIPDLLNTKTTDDDERTRSFMALDWFIREHVPAWFDLTPSLRPSGDVLRALDEINTLEAAKKARPVLAAAGAAAWDAARAAARAAAWAAAGGAAGAAAWAALNPTVKKLQRSAQDLVRRMAEVGR